MIANLTFEDLVTNERGIAVSRALVNVVINQQIGQQISVSKPGVAMARYRNTDCTTGGHYQRGFATTMWVILQYRRCDALQGMYLSAFWPVALAYNTPRHEKTSARRSRREIQQNDRPGSGSHSSMSIRELGSVPALLNVPQALHEGRPPSRLREAPGDLR